MELSTNEKVHAFRELTKGAYDVFAVRSGDFWKPVYSELTDQSVKMHLAGYVELGSYPLIPAEHLGISSSWPYVYWVSADFDGKHPGVNWKAEVRRSVEFLLETGCTLFVNLSRSSQGAHIRVLFRDPVPAWMARRWMLARLDEAQVTSEDDLDGPTSFDRLIPPQNQLKGGTNRDGCRLPGNLIGSPLQKTKAVESGGTLPLNPLSVARGDFVPDGKHWDHVIIALERRSWGTEELKDALGKCPEPQSTEPPTYRSYNPLSIAPGDDRKLEFMVNFCEFMQFLQQPDAFNYHLWMSLATNLHRFGEAGRKMFHLLSSNDARYDYDNTEKKWVDTKDLAPVRCHTLADYGFRCPHLDKVRCCGAAAPAVFPDHVEVEVI